MKPIKAPDTKTLAVLAAIVGLGSKKRPHESVQYAWELWCESESLVRRGEIDASWAIERVGDHLPDIKRPEWKDRLPKRFPATLDDFLRLIVKAKTPADSHKRLKDYFHDVCAETGSKDPEGDAVKSIEFIKDLDKKGGRFKRRAWVLEARSYDAWWRSKKSGKARESAKSKSPKAS